MWLPYEGTLDFFNLSLLLPICTFDLVLSSEHSHCKNRMYLNYSEYIFILRLEITKFAACKIYESIAIQHPSVSIRYRPSPYR